jgi:hypothetical protein
MCVPILGAVIGAGASIAGGVMKAQQQQSYVDAINKSRMEAFNIARLARQREFSRQDKFSRKTQKGLNQTRKDIDAPSQKADMAAAEQKFVSETPGTSDEGYYLSGQKDASSAVLTDVAKTIAGNASDVRGRIGNLAKLSSFATGTAKVGDRLQKNADLLSIWNNIRRGSLGVYEQEASIQPQQINPPDTTMADMLTGVGGMFSKPYG